MVINMTMTASKTESVTPVAASTDKTEKLESVTVTIVPEKEVAVILTQETQKFINQCFDLQKRAADNPYDNPSQFRRDALHEAMVAYLKTYCARVIGTYDNLVTKFSKTAKYYGVGRDKIEQDVRDNQRTKHFYENMKIAVAIKQQLS